MISSEDYMPISFLFIGLVFLKIVYTNMVSLIRNKVALKMFYKEC